GAGASVSVGVIVDDTQASIGGNAQVSADSLQVHAASNDTLSASSKSTPQGANSGSSDNESQKQLGSDHAAGTSASTSSGDVGFAGAITVSDITNTTTAFVASSNSIDITHALDVAAQTTASSTTSADGSNTGSSATGVGVAIAIGVDSLDTEAYIG